MATPEGRFAARVRENLDGCYVTRLESRVGLGIPDCLLAFRGRFVMVELKVVLAGRKVRLSPHQIAFHTKHATYRCPTFVLVEWKGLKRVRLYSGGQAIDLAERGWDVVPQWECGLPGVQWHMLRVELEGA